MPSTPVSSTRRARPDFTPLLAVVLFCLTLLVLVPAHVYLANQSAVLVFFGEMLTATALAAGAVILVLATVLAFVPTLLRQRLTLLLMGLSFLAWIHAYWLVWPYAVMDGRDIDWDAYTGRAIIDAILWVVVIVPLLWFSPRLYPHARMAGWALLGIQCASLGIATFRTDTSPADFFKHYYVESGTVFEFSPKRNVVVFVLDEYQSDVFAEAVLPNPEYRRFFTGFTYFPDTVAGSNYTELALPALLTGQIYDNRQPRAEFLRQAYLDSSLPAVLKRHGIAVDLFPWRGFANEAIYYHEAVASNLKRRPIPLVDKLIDVARLVDMGWFRSAPQFAKRTVYNGARWQLSALGARLLARSATLAPPSSAATPPRDDEIPAGFVLDNTFLELARKQPLPREGVTARSATPTFKCYHLAGLHVPVKMRRDLTWGQFAYTRANYSEQAEAYAKIVGAFLDELRRHNLYDNTMIVIAGDHGSGRDRELYTNPGNSPREAELDRTATEHDFQRDKARGIPLLLVKRFGATGDVRTSRVPASLVDIPATVWSELGISHPPVAALPTHPDFRGTSLFALPADQPRARYYSAMIWAGEKSDFVNPISLYRIQGDSWSDDSWSLAGVLHANRSAGKPSQR